MKRTLKIFFFTVVIMLSILACSLPSSSNGNNNEDDEQRNRVLFQDDFSSTRSGWDREVYEFGSTDYGDDVYRIELTAPEYTAWANPSEDFTDVVIEVDTYKASGGDDNGFGVLCRYEDVENFYMFEISSDGYAWIGKLFDGEFEDLEVIESNEIEIGKATNSLRVECVGNRLSLFINGSLEIEVFDSDLTEGDVGLIAETFTSDTTEILFDNFVVTRP